MKRSEINALVRAAGNCFTAHGWTLPPNPRWDVTDFGLRDWRKYGLVLINLAEEPEYCEKLMYAQSGMTTPRHCHRKKKEDIIARWGTLGIRVWSGQDGTVRLPINGQIQSVRAGENISIPAGSRVTLVPGIDHEFAPTTAECIIGEVSTANDDLHDNYFTNPDVGRFPGVEEDEPALVKLVSDKR